MSDDPSYDERTLLRCVANADEHAFKLLYTAYAPKLYTVALKYLRSPASAQDVVQEIFIKVWKARKQLATIQNFSAYVYVMGRNVILNELRKKATGSITEYLLQLQEPSLLPDVQLRQKEIAAFIREAITSLPPQQQKVYLLSREQELSHKEIAKKLGITYNTVREHMSAALTNIRKSLVQKIKKD
jgi:RNA polymerase sigma-70 factor (family 1)